MPGRKGGKRRGGGGKKKKTGGGGPRFSAVGMGRKIASLSAPIDAAVDAADNFISGDFGGGIKEFFGTLSSDLTAYNPVDKQWHPEKLLVGYGPRAVVEGVNAGLHFLKGMARAFSGRAASRPAF